MEYQNVLLTLTSLFDKYRLNYFVTGSLAVSVYGKPRYSHDFDFKLHILPRQKKDLISFLKELPADFSFDQETLIKSAFSKSFPFDNIIYLPDNLKIDFWFGIKSNFDRECFKRKIKQTVARRPVFFIAPENLILIKLLWHKESDSNRHLEDAASVFQIQKNLDQKYLSLWSKKLKVVKYLKTLKNFPVQEW